MKNVKYLAAEILKKQKKLKIGKKSMFCGKISMDGAGGECYNRDRMKGDGYGVFALPSRFSFRFDERLLYEAISRKDRKGKKRGFFL